MTRFALALVSALVLVACAARSKPDTYSVKPSQDILSYEQAKVAVTAASTHVDFLDQPIRVVEAVPPSYPADAKKARLEGTVLVELTVDERGHVMYTRVVGESNKLLADAAVSAVSQWEFQPHTQGGSPVKVRFRQPVTFKMNPRRDDSDSQ